MTRENNESVVFKYRCWDEYINRYSDFPKMIRDASKYRSYLIEEIWERMQRHNQVLKLFGITERINPNSPLYIDFFEGNSHIDTCSTPQRLSDWALKDDRRPFERDVYLLNGRRIIIEDDFNHNMRKGYDKSNCFITKITFYNRKTLRIGDGKEPVSLSMCKDEKEMDLDHAQDFSLSYKVDACDNPVSLSIEYRDIKMFISNRGGLFRYSEDYRIREINFSTASWGNNDFEVAEYIEEGGIHDRLCGSVFVKESVDELIHSLFYLLGGGFGGTPSNEIEISFPYAQYYSSAIVSHERSQELMRLVLKKLYYRVPKLEEFILEKFPIINKFVGIEKTTVPEIDKVFDAISQPLLTLGTNGFLFDSRLYDNLDQVLREQERRKKETPKDLEKKRRKQMKATYKARQNACSENGFEE